VTAYFVLYFKDACLQAVVCRLLRVEICVGVNLYVVFFWGMPLCSMVLFSPEEVSTLCGRAARLPHHSSDREFRKLFWPVARYPKSRSRTEEEVRVPDDGSNLDSRITTYLLQESMGL
jgi:hypothetical protein